MLRTSRKSLENVIKILVIATLYQKGSVNVNKDLKIDRYIEKLRLAMYEAYSKDPGGSEALRISRKLDELINIAIKSPLKKRG